MIDIIKKASVMFIVLVMVAATGGFTIYQHYCGCSADSATSLVLASHDCNMLAVDDLATNVAPSSCCDEEPAEDHCCSGTSKLPGDPGPVSGCCYTSGIFMKIDDLFNTSLEEVSFQLVVQILKTISGESYSINELPCTVKEIFDRGDPPPLLSGKERILALHQVKIAPPLS